MNNEIFRKKSLERINSPESLNDYVRAVDPGVWLILTAVIVLLAGMCVWGIFGRIETTVECEANIENGVAVIFTGGRTADISVGMTVRIGDKEVAVKEKDLTAGTVTAEIYAPDGVYLASVITERISPFSFVLN